MKKKNCPNCNEFTTHEVAHEARKQENCLCNQYIYGWVYKCLNCNTNNYIEWDNHSPFSE